METELYEEIRKRLGEKIDELNSAYWMAWKEMDTEKKVAYLTGKRAGLTMLTDELDRLFSNGETAVFQIEKDKLTQGHG